MIFIISQKQTHSLLSQGWIILEKDGIIKKVDKVSHGSVEIHFRDGVPYKKTEHVNGLI